MVKWERMKTIEIINSEENIQILKIDDLKIGMILGETIKISDKTTLSKNDTITNDILEMFKNDESIDEVCVYKTKKYYNADFENPDDESVENNNSNVK